MTDVLAAASAVPIYPAHVQELPDEQRRAVDQLCKLDDQYLAAAEEMRKQIRELEEQFEREVAKGLLEQRKTVLANATIPDFWSEVLQHSHAAEMLEEHDLPVLSSLHDITMENFEDPLKGWKLHFHFQENEFFTNKVLTKTYHTLRESKWDVDLDTFKIESTEIEWKEGKDVTMGEKTTGKGKKKKTVAVPQESFFRFFQALGEGAEFPPEVPDSDDEEEDEDELDQDDMEEKMAGLISEDVGRADVFRNLIIPHAIRHYTQEAVEMESDDSDLESDEEDDEDKEDEEDEEEDEEAFETPQKTAAQTKAHKKHGA